MMTWRDLNRLFIHYLLPTVIDPSFYVALVTCPMMTGLGHSTSFAEITSELVFFSY